MTKETSTQKEASRLIDESSKESFPASDPPSWAAQAEGPVVPPNSGEALHLGPEFKAAVLSTLQISGREYHYYSLKAAEKAGLKGLSRLPYTLKIILENLLRFEGGPAVTLNDVAHVVEWLALKKSDQEIAYRPTRVLMQDFTGVPAVVDLAAMRDAIQQLGGDPKRINPLSSVDLVIDHSIQVDEFLTPTAFAVNADLEMKRNYERYEFLRWGQKAFQNFRVVPPDTGICHQVNLEYLAKVVWVEEKEGKKWAFPDTLVGTDSHTTMVNGVGVLGWGVGGIEAEAAMLGQPISMLLPEVIGVQLTGQLKEGVTATDLVLTVTHLLRKVGVVGKFVEFIGEGLAHLSIADRATIGNMSPEYGATCGYFPVDDATLDYLRLSGRDEETIALVKAYTKTQGLWHDTNDAWPVYSDIIQLDLSTVQPSLAGPKRPQDQVGLVELAGAFDQFLAENKKSHQKDQAFPTSDGQTLHHGDVVIAAITSCTNTSNPDVLVAAGLIAKRAVERGLQRKPWVKTSFAPGSQVVLHYLQAMGLQTYLDQLGFSLVGYGCTTCIGNSGPLPGPIAKTITEHDLVVSAVLSGNRNFEGRIHPQVKANWLASPPLVVLFALTGTVQIDLTEAPIGFDRQGKPVYMKELWPSNQEIAEAVSTITRKMFHEAYSNIFTGKKAWQAMQVPDSETYIWQSDSTYIQHPPYFEGMQKAPGKITPIQGARILALLGDSVTTDHISPAGSFKADTPAGQYLISKGVAPEDFNSYGSRRGNHEVMVRGTFANIRIKNEMLSGKEGGFTKYVLTGETMTIYDAAMRYQTENIPLVVIAGKEYGTGSSRDWAAKGPKLLGVTAVIAESFERIHRSNLIGMGILPLEFVEGQTRKTLELTGDEEIDLEGLDEHMKPRQTVCAVIRRKEGPPIQLRLLSRIDTANEMDYYRHGGILQRVVRDLL